MDARDELQTLTRGLAALVFLTRNGPTNLTTLARHLDVPRTNAYRIVMTLLAEGYCRRIPNSHLYLAAPLVSQLAHGMRDSDLLTNVALHRLGQLGQQIKWPLALSVPEQLGMRVCLATDLSTPLALAKISPGYVTPMLRATTGVLYLALERKSVRDPLIKKILAAGQGLDTSMGQAELQLVFEQARQNGYVVFDTVYREASIGVPILIKGRPIGGIVMRYIKSSTTRRKVETTYLEKLRSLALEMAVDFEKEKRAFWGGHA
jgi:IclR family mhp operon transcriptional activator